MEDVGYPNDPDQVALIPGAPGAVRDLVAVGFVPAVVSNQSGLARGLITPDQAKAVHDRFVQLFEAASGVRLPCYYCPHGPDDGCDCRKPKPGLLRRAAAELGMAGKPGVIVGDKESDVQTVWIAPGVNYTGVLLGDPNRYPYNWQPDWAYPGGGVGPPGAYVAADWVAARRWIKKWLAAVTGGET
jgi:histidinol-phosphate phosphatase family protein